MKPELIIIIVSALGLVITIISAAWLNHNATMRVNQQLLEGLKLVLHQMEKRFDERFEHMEKRSDERFIHLEKQSDERFTSLATEMRVEIRRLDQQIGNLQHDVRQGFSEVSHQIKSFEVQQQIHEDRVEHRIHLLEQQVENRLHRIEMQVTTSAASSASD